jgi:hypothetical protein
MLKSSSRKIYLMLVLFSSFIAGGNEKCEAQDFTSPCTKACASSSSGNTANCVKTCVASANTLCDDGGGTFTSIFGTACNLPLTSICVTNYASIASSACCKS